MHDQKLTKVSIQLPADQWSPASSEVLWAEPVGSGEFCLRNVPFFAYGYAYADVVVAGPNENGIVVVSGIARRSGHSTYRVIAVDKNDLALFEDYCGRLHAMGCGMEGATADSRAIDVPPTADVYEVRALLEEGDSKGLWHFEEAFMGHRPS